MYKVLHSFSMSRSYLSLLNLSVLSAQKNKLKAALFSAIQTPFYVLVYVFGLLGFPERLRISVSLVKLLNPGS